jgi:hypothetical protein
LGVRSSEIEAWTLSVIQQVKRRQPCEDARVELKAAWPNDAYKAARRIAGHANASGGEPVLWIIGVDEKAGAVGAAHNELANWRQQVESHFDGLAPGMTDVNVPVGDATVVALLFDTERRPFVVRTPGGSTGQVTREVPWREGTSVRSANRDELIPVLHRLQRLPKWEPINGPLDVEPLTQPRMKGNTHHWLLKMKLYVVPEGRSREDRSRVCIPFHRCSGTLDFPAFGSKPRLRRITLTPYDRGSVSIKGSNSELVIDDPGMVTLEADAESLCEGVFPHIDGHLSVDLRTADSEYAGTIQAKFTFDDAANKWIFGDVSEESEALFG